MKALYLCITALVLTGCANMEASIKATSDANATMAVSHAAAEQKPLLDLELYEDGRLKKIYVGRQLNAPAYAPMPVDPSIAVWDRALSTVGLIAAPFAVLKGSASLVNSVGNVVKQLPQPQTPVTPQANVTTTTNYTAPTTNTTTTNTSTLSGTGVLGSGTYTANPTTTTSTLSGAGVLGTGNYNPVDSHAVSNTATPTIVTQPPPVQIPAGRICTTDAKGVTTCQ